MWKGGGRGAVREKLTRSVKAAEAVLPILHWGTHPFLAARCLVESVPMYVSGESVQHLGPMSLLCALL